jgi:hypothetical protein
MLQDGVEKGVGDLLRFIITQASRREQNGEINGRKRYDPKLKNLTNSLPTVPRPFTTVARFLYYYYYCQPPRPRFPDLDHLLMGVVLHFLAAFHAFMKPSSSGQKVFFSKTENTLSCLPSNVVLFFKFGS